MNACGDSPKMINIIKNTSATKTITHFSLFKNSGGEVVMIYFHML